MNDTRKIQYIGSGAPIRQHVPQMVVDFPRSMVHHHTYGLLTPFFVGLREGRLMATRCTNPACPEKKLWVPPRADCPDCYERMAWEEIPQPIIGKIYAYTQVVYAGVGIELTTPYWQIDVEIPGLATIPKSYLLHGTPKTGMKVKAVFRTEYPTNTVLDYCWEPYEEK